GVDVRLAAAVDAVGADVEARLEGGNGGRGKSRIHDSGSDADGARRFFAHARTRVERRSAAFAELHGAVTD
ncbi:hypothetical protein CATMIT_01595, partial [Catenibacterium mitsuokai DSM 15897]